MIAEPKPRELVEAAMDVSQEVLEIFRSIDSEEVEIRRSLSSVIYLIMENIVHPILREFPEFKSEFEEKMNKPGGS
jgi:hypothetical protein